MLGDSSVQSNSASGEGGAVWVAAACEGVGPLEGRCPTGLRLAAGGLISDCLAAGGSGGAVCVQGTMVSLGGVDLRAEPAPGSQLLPFPPTTPTNPATPAMCARTQGLLELDDRSAMTGNAATDMGGALAGGGSGGGGGGGYGIG